MRPRKPRKEASPLASAGEPEVTPTVTADESARRVEELRRAIAAGTYEVDARTLAGELVRTVPGRLRD